VGWSRRAWVALYGLALLAFVHILLRPGTGYVSDTSVSPPSVVIGLFVGFAVFSFAFWGWFRFRRSSEAVVGEPLPDQVEGDAGEGAHDHGLAAHEAGLHGRVLTGRPLAVVLVAHCHPVQAGLLVVAGHVGERLAGRVHLAPADTRLAGEGVGRRHEQVAAD